MSNEWTIETSCPPYSEDVFLWDGSDSYCVADPCERCECEIARIDPDGETDSEGYTRNLTRYFCADCGARTHEVHTDSSPHTLRRCLAASMFRGFSQLKAQLREVFGIAGQQSGHEPQRENHMSDENEPIDGPEKTNIHVCLGILSECIDKLMDAQQELIAIKGQYLLALRQPKRVAFDTTAPLDERLRRVEQQLKTIIK